MTKTQFVTVSMFAAFVAAGAVAGPAAAAQSSRDMCTIAHDDLNGDGRISLAEFDRAVPGNAAAIFVYADRDNDGFLGADELRAANRRAISLDRG